MLTAAAFVPATPMLVPEVAQGAAGELDDLRAACRAALGVLADSRPDVVVVVAVADATGDAADDAVGDLRGLGIDLAVAVDPARAGARALSLGQTLGVWLLDAIWPDIPRRVVGVAEAAGAAEARALGSRLAATEERVGLLVVGDGSAAQVEASPLYVVPGAVDADRAAIAAVGAADLDVIAGWEPAWGTTYAVSGRAPWQVAAGAAQARAADEPWRAECTYDAAPYGVTYLVATWS